jgi:ketosteroid isomerase-like protein
MTNPTRRTAIAITALASTAPVSFAQALPSNTATSIPPAEIQSLIDSHINAFNTQDNKLLFSVFGDTAIIIDGIAPFRWLNPNAPANWLADVEKWREGLGVTKEHLLYEMGFWNVEGSSAYAVVIGTLTITTKDQSIVRTGTLAYTFAKRDGVWKIEAQAWGRTS